jgi:NAD(P)-dependent dehydrogenase (short-subunit alcohol dehydrogenase family)
MNEQQPSTSARPGAAPFSLKGRTALVTGAGRGIGRGIATAMARCGADVIVLDVDAGAAESTAADIASLAGVRTWAEQADLLQPARVPEVAARIAGRCGDADILVNNAGLQVRKPALEFTWDEWNRVLTIHLSASFMMAQALAPGMIRRGRGAVVNIASLNSVMAVPNIVAYTAAKSGVAGLTRSLAVEWAQHNIRVNAIGPGWTRTALTEPLLAVDAKREAVMSRIPMRRFAEPEADLGYVAVFLASEAAAYITGQVVYVDGGWLAG